MAALFCDEACRNQASCTLHLTITNSICSLKARGPLEHLPSSHPARQPVSTLASRGDIVQLPSSGQLSDQQIPGAPRDEMEVSARRAHILPHPHPHPHPHPRPPGHWPHAAGNRMERRIPSHIARFLATARGPAGVYSKGALSVI